MKLFVSYSRDDKVWVYELCQALHDKAYHDVWIDRRIIPATDWWDAILSNIDVCECFIYIMTPKSVESMYCNTEMRYALALNKPILPLMLKPCKYPTELKTQRVQYQDIDADFGLVDVLLIIERAIGEIRVSALQGKYQTPQHKSQRPEEPKPRSHIAEITEVFILAEESATENNFTLAEKLFRQVIQSDSHLWGKIAYDRLREVQIEQKRNFDYAALAQMASSPTALMHARETAKMFVERFGVNYDPQNLLPYLIQEQAEKLGSPALHVGPTLLDKHAISKDESTILGSYFPQPFVWIEIPPGNVELVALGEWAETYIPNGKPSSFDVPAFSISKYPVTNAQYREFINAQGYSQRRWWLEEGWELKNKMGWEAPHNWSEYHTKFDHPVVGVSWHEALAFCRWMSDLTGDPISLPTEQQWQLAAQGNTERAYPWGNKFDRACCNFKSDGTTPVTQFDDKGTGPSGVSDQSGNVWEWCLSKFETGETNLAGNEARVIRGGSWREDIGFYLRVDYRNKQAPASRDSFCGFRIVL